jgi:glycosyltransferase involved in cell wall biosynthesis
MRVVMVSKALVAGAYQRKAEEIARLGVELTVLVPPAWRDRRGSQIASPLYTTGYTYRTVPIRWGGNFHLHYYPTLGRELARLRPAVLHMDEEPYNLATYLALAAARRLGMAALFFSWQNLERRYPPPFAWFERANYAAACYAIAGNQDAAAILQRKGYRGPLAVLPQFGVDPAIFAPAATPLTTGVALGGPLRVGYAGGLLAEKGVDLLLEACARLSGPWQLQIAGEGDQARVLVAQAARLGIAERVHFAGRVAGEAMPAFYRGLDVLALPSRTLPSWKEQFGRVLIEAMASGVAVVGSSSGEIPHVIGEAGLIFPEGNVAGLAAQLQKLADDPTRRVLLSQAGRERVLDCYSMAEIAARTVAIYRQCLR